MASSMNGQGSGLPQGNQGDEHDQQNWEGLLDKSKEWSMEVYKGKESGESEEGEEEIILELDLEEGETDVAAKLIAIAVYFSQKLQP
jgi:hypothetical protein